MTSLQCVEAFSPAQPGEEQNHEEHGLQSGQYLHIWGGVITVFIVVTQKGGSCIPWNPTSPRETHENVFIRNDLPSMSRGLFPTAVYFGKEQNRKGYEPPKRTISTQVGWGGVDTIRLLIG